MIIDITWHCETCDRTNTSTRAALVGDMFSRYLPPGWIRKRGKQHRDHVYCCDECWKATW